jgi:hypothetical protein
MAVEAQLSSMKMIRSGRCAVFLRVMSWRDRGPYAVQPPPHSLIVASMPFQTLLSGTIDGFCRLEYVKVFAAGLKLKSILIVPTKVTFVTAVPEFALWGS